MQGNPHVRFDERDVETELWSSHLGTARRKGRKQTCPAYRHRATSRLYPYSADPWGRVRQRAGVRNGRADDARDPPCLDNDEIAGWRRRGHRDAVARGHRDADARRGARFYPGRWALPHHRDMAPFIPLWNECRRHLGLAGRLQPSRHVESGAMRTACSLAPSDARNTRRPAVTPHRGHESADARDARLAAQPVEGGQDRAQIIRLIEAEIAKREDERPDDGGRDLDDEPHRRVRRRAVARPCIGWGRAAFLAPAKRARLGIAVSQVGDRQRAARNGALGPTAAGAVEGGAACGLAKDLRRAAPPTLEWLSTPQASRRGRGRHGALNFGSAAAISSPARATTRRGASVTAATARASR